MTDNDDAALKNRVTGTSTADRASGRDTSDSRAESVGQDEVRARERPTEANDGDGEKPVGLEEFIRARLPTTARLWIVRGYARKAETTLHLRPDCPELDQAKKIRRERYGVHRHRPFCSTCLGANPNDREGEFDCPYCPKTYDKGVDYRLQHLLREHLDHFEDGDDVEAVLGDRDDPEVATDGGNPAPDPKRHPADVAQSILSVCDSAEACLNDGELARLEAAAEFVERLGDVLEGSA